MTLLALQVASRPRDAMGNLVQLPSATRMMGTDERPVRGSTATWVPVSLGTVYRPIVRRIVRPLEEFVSQEAGSGAILLAAAIVALVWANAAPHSYEDFWHTEVVAGIGALDLHLDLRGVVNDGLMAVFFYVVTLEVKREFISACCATAATRRCRSPPRSGRWWVPR